MKINGKSGSSYEKLLLGSPTVANNTGSLIEDTVVQCADAALNVFRVLSGRNVLPGITGSQLLSERVAYLDLQQPGTHSSNGSCRLIKTQTDWIALNMARDDDWELISAWLQTEKTVKDWEALEPLIVSGNAVELVERGRLLGLPISLYNSIVAKRWFSVLNTGNSRHPLSQKSPSPLVVDLSSLWAGPLCSHLLQQMGATVIKVESTSRPDTTRVSAPKFHHLLNAGKQSVLVDLNNPGDISKLKKLIASADIVIESSRPRALRQLGIHAEKFVDSVPGLTWLSITGYGRQEPQSNWIAFGDDAAIAGGLAVATNGELHFIGDAIADPLTGIHAAIIALKNWKSGKAGLIDISLSGVASFIYQHVRVIDPIDDFSTQLISPHPIRTTEALAPQLGADTEVVFGGI